MKIILTTTLTALLIGASLGACTGKDQQNDRQVAPAPATQQAPAPATHQAPAPTSSAPGSSTQPPPV